MKRFEIVYKSELETTWALGYRLKEGQMQSTWPLEMNTSAERGEMVDRDSAKWNLMYGKISGKGVSILAEERKVKRVAFLSTCLPQFKYMYIFVSNVWVVYIRATSGICPSNKTWGKYRFPKKENKAEQQNSPSTVFASPFFHCLWSNRSIKSIFGNNLRFWKQDKITSRLHVWPKRQDKKGTKENSQERPRLIIFEMSKQKGTHRRQVALTQIWPKMGAHVCCKFVKDYVTNPTRETMFVPTKLTYPKRKLDQLFPGWCESGWKRFSSLTLRGPSHCLPQKPQVMHNKLPGLGLDLAIHQTEILKCGTACRYSRIWQERKVLQNNDKRWRQPVGTCIAEAFAKSGTNQSPCDWNAAVHVCSSVNLSWQFWM